MSANNMGMIQGRFTADPELKYYSSGRPYCDTCLAVRKVQKGEKGLEITSLFFYVQWHGKKAEQLCKVFTKGDAANVWYELDINSWEKDGKRHNRIKLNGIDFGFSLGGADHPDTYKPQERRASPSIQKPQEASDADIDRLVDSLQDLSDDECPF